ncbi:serine hydrolase domain-containing protein [Lederbergia graminis]|uniref:Serine hydrolase domain-containing protein n=1 Tax=Lederbergia graminis TaxID=735518 RepID=A0ABW0LL14_9BACI
MRDRQILEKICKEVDFSGVVLMKNNQEHVLQFTRGYANRADELKNSLQTKFGIASGCKLFTAIAICQLVEKGQLTFNTKLQDCLHTDFPHFAEDITIHHLLTHTSGISDYFDETVMDDFEDLWKETAMYNMRNLKDFLPLFHHHKMMFQPGDRFHYNNAGFIVLGLIIEQLTGVTFTEYVEANIFAPCGMEDSGYFSLDQLPKNTAIGYIDHEDGSWKSNSYSIPIKGGADGGAYITAEDMTKCWNGLLQHKLLSEKYTLKLLTPYVSNEDGDYYGYGIWIEKRNDVVYKYHVMGYDPGVCFHSAFYPSFGMTVVIPSNKSYGAYDITEVIEENYLS